jgi:thiosulfate/3-mercaptopyruvate sulfurtransferase
MHRALLAFALSLSMSPLASTQAPAKPNAAMLVTVGDLAAHLKDADLVVLHVADRASAFEDAHIPGARFLRYADFAIDGADAVGSELPPAADVERVLEAAGVSDSSRVVIYAANAVVAARAFFTLEAFGHTRVAVLDGGLNAWRAAKQPLETGASTNTRAGAFTPRLNTQKVATAAWIQQQMPAKGISLVDVRPDPEFTGSDGGMGGQHAAGHIEGAQQLTWNALVNPDGTFLPPDQLQSRLQSAGVVPGRPVVSYCMVGMRASVVYFVARYLGYDARLYDGSIVDWSQKKLPVKTGK